MQTVETITIKSWAEDDRPREKLALKGRGVLSNAELLAIIIGSGSRDESAVALSKRILNNVAGSLQRLGKLSIVELTKFKGIGEAKAISIIAATELGRRRGGEVVEQKAKITTSKIAFNILQPIIADYEHEEFWVLFLDRSNQMIRKEQISKGGVAGTVVDTRVVFKLAVECLACGIILAHNHPSGRKQPSEADKSLTKKLKEAGRIMEVTVLDHLIVTPSDYYSFADEGIL